MLVLAGAMSANAALTANQSIGIDFATTGPSTGSGYGAETDFNVLNGNGNLADGTVIDTNGSTLSGVSISLTGAFSDNAPMGDGDVIGYDTAAPGAYYDGTPYSDLSFNDGIFTSPGNAFTITISGLSDALTYDISAIGRIGRLDGNTFSLTAGDNAVSDSDTYGNIANVAGGSINPLSVSGATSTGGVLTITFDDPTDAEWYGVNALHVTAVSAAAVPEPSSTALLGLGGLALILRRRK